MGRASKGAAANPSAIAVRPAFWAARKIFTATLRRVAASASVQVSFNAAWIAPLSKIRSGAQIRRSGVAAPDCDVVVVSVSNLEPSAAETLWCAFDYNNAFVADRCDGQPTFVGAIFA